MIDWSATALRDQDARDRLDRLAAACLPLVVQSQQVEPFHRAVAMALALRDAGKCPNLDF